jgi:hypothetical protein
MTKIQSYTSTNSSPDALKLELLDAALLECLMLSLSLGVILSYCAASKGSDPAPQLKQDKLAVLCFSSQAEGRKLDDSDIIFGQRSTIWVCALDTSYLQDQGATSVIAILLHHCLTTLMLT